MSSNCHKSTVVARKDIDVIIEYQTKQDMKDRVMLYHLYGRPMCMECRHFSLIYHRKYGAICNCKIRKTHSYYGLFDSCRRYQCPTEDEWDETLKEITDVKREKQPPNHHSSRYW